MAREYLPKLAIAIIALGIAVVLLSGQTAQVAAAPAATSSPRGYHYGVNDNGTGYCDNYYWGSYYYCDYYYSYYPYYYDYWYGYPYYYDYYYSYPYYSSYYGYGYGYPYTSSYTLTVNTDPSSLGTVTGGGSYNSGSSASFSVTQSTIQTSPNTRYVFSHWSGDYSGSGTSGTVTVNSAMKITAVYQLQYYLSVQAQPQNAPSPQGAGWYNAGDTAALQNGGQTIGDSGSRLVFQGWSVDGGAPQSGSTLSLQMNVAHSVTALYGQQYYLNVQTDQGVPYGSGWYNSGSTAQIYVSTPVSTTYGVAIVFNGWQGDVQSTSQSTTVLMDGPKNAIATWRTDPTVLYLTIGAVIVAALLIVAGLIAFMSRSRGGSQAPPQQVQHVQQPPNSMSTTHSEPTTTTQHHRKKPTTDTTEPSESST